MKSRRQVKGFLSLEPWIVYVCLSEGEWARQKYLSAFERGMVVGVRYTGLCQELHLCRGFHTQQFPVCNKNGPPPKRHPANLTQTVGSIGVNMGHHPCGNALDTL